MRTVARRYRYETVAPVGVPLDVEPGDNSIERAVREITGVREGIIPDALLARVVELRVSGHGLRDLRPLARLPRLERLWIRTHARCALEPLHSLPSLRELALTDLPLDDLAPLAALTQLRALRLENLPPVDLGPLASLGSLEDLCLRRTRVASLAPLAGLTQLRELELTDGVLLEDLSALAALPSLRYINVTGTRVLRVGGVAARARAGELQIDGLECEPNFRVVAESSSPPCDARGLCAEIGREAERLLRWPCAVKGLITDGGATLPFGDNGWKVPARSGLGAALEQIWRPLALRAPGFSAQLAAHVVALALLEPLGGDDPALAYLYRRACVCHPRDSYGVLIGRAPSAATTSAAFRLPAALRELYAVHGGLASGDVELLTPEAVAPLTPECRGRLDGFRRRNQGQLPDQFRVFLKDGDAGGKVFDLDRLDVRNDPIVRRWYPETIEVEGNSSFWDWFADEAPELLLHTDRN